MIFKRLLTSCTITVLSGCALVAPDAPVNAVYPVSDAPKIPALFVDISREYLFSNSEETRSRGSTKQHPVYNNGLQTTSRKGPFFLKEKDLMTRRLKDTLFSTDDNARLKGKLSVDYTVQTTAKCSLLWPVLTVSTLFTAPAAGLPANQACAFVSVSATISDVFGKDVKTYTINKTRTMNLGFWYDRWSLTPADNPLQDILVNEATADLANQISADAPTLTKALNNAFAEKQSPKKKRSAVRKKTADDFY